MCYPDDTVLIFSGKIWKDVLKKANTGTNGVKNYCPQNQVFLSWTV